MAIENRDLSGNEQRVPVYSTASAVVQGTNGTWVAGPVPYPCKVIGLEYVADGISGAALGHFLKKSWAGTSLYFGYSMGISALAFQNVGTSGPQGYSGFAAPGSTLLNLQMGDTVTFNLSGGSQIGTLQMNLIIQKVADITPYDGFPTVS